MTDGIGFGLLEDGSVFRWGAEYRLDFPFFYGFEDQRWKVIDAGPSSVCGINFDDEAICWVQIVGVERVVALFPNEKPAIGVSTYMSTQCVLYEDLSVYCRDTTYGEIDIPPDVRVSQVSAGAAYAFGIDAETGELVQFGEPLFYSLPIPEGSFQYIHSGFVQGVAIDIDGNLVAYGSDPNLINPIYNLKGFDLPADGPYSIVVADSFAGGCALRSDQNVECFTLDGEPYSVLLSPLRTEDYFVTLDIARGNYVCGLLDTGEAHCWGGGVTGRQVTETPMLE